MTASNIKNIIDNSKGNLQYQEIKGILKANTYTVTSISELEYSLTASTNGNDHYGVTFSEPCSIIITESSDIPDGKIITIKDESGMASTNNITISSTNNITINGTSNYIISSNYGCISLIRKNNSWWIIGLLGDNFMKQDEINDILLPTISFNIVPASKSIYTWSSTNEWRDIFYIIPANLDGMEISKMYTSYGDAWPATSSRVFHTQLRDSLNQIAGASLMWEHPSSSRIYATFSDSHVILKEGYTLNINSMTDPQIDDGAKGYSVTFQLKPVPHEQIIS